MEGSKCYYCQSRKIIVLNRIKGFNICQCRVCGLVFTALPKGLNTTVINTQFYSDNYIKNYLSKLKEQKKRFSAIIAHLEKYKKGGKILDVGCGLGIFIETLLETSKFTWETYGIDINRRVLKITKQRLKSSKITLGSLSSIRFPSEHFDCITCLDVLEHDTQIMFNLNEIKRILKKNGILIIQAPNHNSLMANLTGTMWDWWAVPDHVIHFSPQNIRQILIKEGFKSELYTRDPRNDFIENISGVIRNTFPSMININKIFAKLSRIPLNVLWLVFKFLESKFDIGGLMIVYATRNNKL